MKHHPAFLHDIIEHPNDDAPRLIYADWLDEHGGAEEQARAEFIRVQIELARLGADNVGWQMLQSHITTHGKRPLSAPGDPRMASLFQRERDLWLEHVFEWRKELPAAGFEEVRRGFAREMYADAGWFVKSGAVLWRQAPVVSVRLFNVDAGVLRRLTRCPHMSRLQSLEVYNSRFGPEGARVLQGAASFAHLGSLRLSGANLGPEGARALAESSYLSSLQTLDLHANRILRDGALALADSPYLGQLRTFGLSMNGLRVGAVRLLAGSVNLTNLQRLGLAMNSLHADAAEALANSTCLRHLTDLDLLSNSLGAEGAAVLAGATFAPNLSSLNLAHNDIGDRGVAALASSAGLSQLDALILWGNKIGNAGARALIESPHLANLKLLALENNPIGPRLKTALRQRFGTRVFLETQDE
jgi:uncharacterized protein (TIGR02996 family)